ncbi:MAG: tetratricopeptide repeat protein [Candidatus Nitrosopolaris sp.]
MRRKAYALTRVANGNYYYRGKFPIMTNGSSDIDTQGDVSGVNKDSVESLAAKSIHADGNLVINNSTLEDRETLKKIQDLSTEINAIEKGIVSREEFNALQQAVIEIKNLLEKNQAYSIKAGDVQVSHTELSVKEIILKGNEYLSRRDYSMALDYYDQAIKIDPKYADAWINKGLAIHNLRKYNEAIESYDKAIEIDPKYADAWNNKGVSLGKLGKYKEAIECCDRAVKIDPNYANAWNNKGIALRILGQQKDADRCFAKARDLSKPHVFRQSFLRFFRRSSRCVKAH